MQNTPAPVWLNISSKVILKFVALLPRARFTEVRAEVWDPLIMVEPPVGGQRVPVGWVSWLEGGGRGIVRYGRGLGWVGRMLGREGRNGMRTVRHVCCFVHVGTGIDPLTSWFFEGATAPCGCEETEVSICARGEGGDCEEGGGQHGRCDG